MIDQATIPRVDAILAKFLVQKKTFVIRKDAYKKRLKSWAIKFFSTPNFIASSISLNGTGVGQNGLQKKIVSMTLKHSRQRCLKP